MKKTLQECKEIVAREDGWDNWNELTLSTYTEYLTDLANKMYYEQSEDEIPKNAPSPPKDRILKEGQMPIKPLPSPTKQ